MSKALKISVSAITSHLHKTPPVLALQRSPPVIKEKPSLSLIELMETLNRWRSLPEEGTVLEYALLGAGQFLEAGCQHKLLISAAC